MKDLAALLRASAASTAVTLPKLTATLAQPAFGGKKAAPFVAGGTRDKQHPHTWKGEKRKR